MSILSQSYSRNDVTITNISRSLSHAMTEKQLAVMKKLRHCHRMYIVQLYSISFLVTIFHQAHVFLSRKFFGTHKDGIQCPTDYIIIPSRQKRSGLTSDFTATICGHLKNFGHSPTFTNATKFPWKMTTGWSDVTVISISLVWGNTAYCVCGILCK